MRIRKTPLLLLLLISMNGFSQRNESYIVTDVTKITFLNPGIGYEKAIGKFQTLAGQAFMNLSVSASYSSSLGSNTDIGFDPGLVLQYRYYFNYDRRKEMGKRTSMNSMNYFSPTVQTILSKLSVSSDYYSESKRRSINSVGVVWGFQRNYPGRFSLDVNIGPGYLFTTGTTQITPERIVKNISQFSLVGQLNLGIWLGKKK